MTMATDRVYVAAILFLTGASFAAKGFFALLGIKVANLFFGK